MFVQTSGFDSAPEPSSALACEITFHSPDDPGRMAVEAFVRGIYARRYGADVRQFSPILVALREHGEILASAGYRNAADGPLFLERYLHRPVDEAISSMTGLRPGREAIVEVGHLAAMRGGEGRRLIQMLAPRLSAQGFEWVASTVTQELRKMVVRLGAAPLTLAAADVSALGEDNTQWGSYYDHHPVVLATHLRRALRRHAARRGHGAEAAE